MSRSLHVVRETFLFLFLHVFEDLVVLLSQFVVIVLLELWPLSFRLASCFLLGQVVQLLRNSALLEEFGHFLHVFLLHVGSVGRILGLEEDGEELEHRFLDGQGWILEARLADLAKSLRDDRAKSLLQEGDGVIFLLEGVEGHWVLCWRDLDWKLVLLIDVPGWVQEELHKLLLARQGVFVVLELDA